MVTLGSLFDGIGGFPLAASRHGIKTLWASEIEEFPIRVTKHHFPNMQHVGDLTKLDGSTLPPVDIISGGSPCQDLSIAGNREGLAGERSGLFMEQIRIIKEMRHAEKETGRTAFAVRPRYMLWENVPGAFSSEDGNDFHAVLEETLGIVCDGLSVPRPPSGKWLASGAIVGDKFSIAWRVFDAQHWGLPQRRKRIFLVADFAGRTAPKILFKQTSLQRNSTTCRGERKNTAYSFGTSTSPSVQHEDVPCLNDQGGQYMNLTNNITGTLRAQMGGHLPIVMDPPTLFDNHRRSGRYNGPLPVSPTICAAAGTGGNNLPLALSGESYCIAGNIIGREHHNGGNGLGCQSAISYTLTASDRHAVFAPYQDTIGALCAGDQKGVGNQYVDQGKCIVDTTQLVRRLTPLECERLQGFPDDWTNIPKAADSPRYKALGNSIAIPCAEFIFAGLVFYSGKEF